MNTENHKDREESKPTPTASDKPTPTIRTRKARVAIGAVGIFALGLLIGISITQHVAGVPAAVAATDVPKHSPPPAASPAQAATKATEWNPFQEIRDMQLRMDQLFDHMTDQFRLEPRLSAFKSQPGYSLSLRVQDLKDRYEVHAYLPNAKASDVSASLLDKQTLKVEVDNKTTEASSAKGGKEQVTQWGQYAQVIQLPAPVKSEEMKIDQANHELVITLPKA